MAMGREPGIISKVVIQMIAKYYPSFTGALLAINNKGEYGK